MNKPNCYECIWRWQYQNTMQQSCLHPDVKNVVTNPHVAKMVVELEPLVVMNSRTDAIKIEYDKKGRMRHLFAWPVKFDPVYLLKCTGFKIKN